MQTNDLKMILTSKQWKPDEKPAVEIGKRFASLRQRKHLALSEVALFLERDGQIALKIEYGNLNRDATFHHYVQYARGLSSSLQDILKMVLYQEELPLEEELLKKVDETAQRLLAQGTPTTPAQVAGHLGISLQRLRESPRINALLIVWEDLARRTRARRNEQREEELVQQVKSAIKHLELLREPVTQQNIARLTGISFQGLRIYPQVETLLIQVTTNARQVPSKPYVTNRLARRSVLLNDMT